MVGWDSTRILQAKYSPAEVDCHWDPENTIGMDCFQLISGRMPGEFALGVSRCFELWRLMQVKTKCKKQMKKADDHYKSSSFVDFQSLLLVSLKHFPTLFNILAPLSQHEPTRRSSTNPWVCKTNRFTLPLGSFDPLPERLRLRDAWHRDCPWRPH